MQNKIALEEHVAIDATLSNSQVFGAHVWHDLRPRLLDMQDMRLGEMDRHGIEMMILSLNAPAVQAIHEIKTAIAVARLANDVLADEVAKGPAALPRSPRCRCRIRTPRPPSSPAASRISEWSALWSTASRKWRRPRAPSITTCRNTERSGARWKRSTCRSTCTRAIRCRAGRNSMTAIPGCSAPTGPSPRKPRCMRCG